ncbi:hypothetical protein [Sulfitobacter sp. JB4-11]|uniref:hypothetical protein n=1 Tax=Sulfitobacter rhodophyticola TaxID=3238304 RepID=UPI003515853B
MSNDPTATDNTAQDEPPMAPNMRPLFTEEGRAIFGYADAAVAEAIVQKLSIYFWKHEKICGLGKDNAQPNVGLMPNAFRPVTGLPANNHHAVPFSAPVQFISCPVHSRCNRHHEL